MGLIAQNKGSFILRTPRGKKTVLKKPPFTGRGVGDKEAQGACAAFSLI